MGASWGLLGTSWGVFGRLLNVLGHLGGVSSHIFELHNVTRVGRNPMLRVYMFRLMLTTVFTLKDADADALACLRRCRQ